MNAMDHELDMEFTLYDHIVDPAAPPDWEEVVTMWEETVERYKDEAFEYLTQARQERFRKESIEEYCHDRIKDLNRANHVIHQASCLMNRAKAQGFVMPTLAEIEREIDTKQIGMAI